MKSSSGNLPSTRRRGSGRTQDRNGQVRKKKKKRKKLKKKNGIIISASQAWPCSMLMLSKFCCMCSICWMIFLCLFVCFVYICLFVFVSGPGEEGLESFYREWESGSVTRMREYHLKWIRQLASSLVPSTKHTWNIVRTFVEAKRRAFESTTSSSSPSPKE